MQQRRYQVNDHRVKNMSLLHLRSFFSRILLRSNNQQICLLLILVSLRLLFSPFKIDRDLYLVQRHYSDLLYMDVDRNIRAFRLFAHVSFVFLSSFFVWYLHIKRVAHTRLQMHVRDLVVTHLDDTTRTLRHVCVGPIITTFISQSQLKTLFLFFFFCFLFMCTNIGQSLSVSVCTIENLDGKKSVDERNRKCCNALFWRRSNWFIFQFFVAVKRRKRKKRRRSLSQLVCATGHHLSPSDIFFPLHPSFLKKITIFVLLGVYKAAISNTHVGRLGESRYRLCRSLSRFGTARTWQQNTTAAG